MTMKNNVGYYIKEGVSSVFTHGFMSIASVCITVACLIVMGCFSLLALNVNSIIKDFEDENVVLAFVDENYTTDMAMELKSDILATEHVKDAEFISRESAYKSFVSKYDDRSAFADIDSAVLRDRFAVYLDDIENTSDVQIALKSIPGLVDINANLKVAKAFVTVRNIVSVVSIILVVILIVISLFIMSNTVKLTTFDRRDEIGIMKMVGATNSFIRWPFVLEGFVLGLIGALVAYLIQWGIYEMLANLIQTNYKVSFITLLPFSFVAVPLLVVFLIIGLGVGIGGSIMAIKNYLNV